MPKKLSCDGKCILPRPLLLGSDAVVPDGATSDGWEAYYVPIEFSAVDTFVRVIFDSGEEVFWNLGK